MPAARVVAASLWTPALARRCRRCNPCSMRDSSTRPSMPSAARKSSTLPHKCLAMRLPKAPFLHDLGCSLRRDRLVISGHTMVTSRCMVLPNLPQRQGLPVSQRRSTPSRLWSETCAQNLLGRGVKLADRVATSSPSPKGQRDAHGEERRAEPAALRNTEIAEVHALERHALALEERADLRHVDLFHRPTSRTGAPCEAHESHHEL